MLRYLIFITIGILLYLLLNIYNTFSIGVPVVNSDLDNRQFFQNDQYFTEGIADNDFQYGYRVFTFNTDIGNIVIDNYDTEIPQRITDVGLIYVANNIEVIPTDADIEWWNTNTIFISPIDRGINYDGDGIIRDIYDTYTINGTLYRRIRPAELSGLFGMYPAYTPTNRYRLVNIYGYIYIYQGNTPINRVIHPDRKAYRNLADWCAVGKREGSR